MKPVNKANETDPAGRRRILKTGMLAAAALMLRRLTSCAESAEQAAETAGLRQLRRKAPIIPPGAASVDDFLRRCTACGLCVENCPTGTLTISSDEYGAANALKPTLKFDSAFCRQVCTRCSHVCPTGALTPLAPEEKLLAPIGKAEISKGQCIAAADGVSCGVCARRCPVEAITIDETGPTDVPVLDARKCIGCGACEYICPADAIIVSGIT